MGKYSRSEEIALVRGYYVSEAGDVIGPNGHPIVCIPARGYLRFAIRSERMLNVYVHRLQAFQKFGGRVYLHGVVVRHIDGNPLNNSRDNIAIGTNRDNQLDRAPEDRSRSSQLGLQTRDRVSDHDVVVMRLLSAEGETDEAIGKRFDLRRETVRKIVNGTRRASCGGPIRQKQPQHFV